jgi:DNA processing protein
MLLLRQGFEGHERFGVQTSDLYAFTVVDWKLNFGFTDATAQKIATGLADKKILERELALIEQHKINWMTIADEMYPQLLKEIYLPPIVLYWWGGAWDENASVHPECPKGVYRRVAIVGARKGNEYGKRVVNAIVPDLVAAGYTVVSGGALGIDTMAHEAALQCGGKTIAILGSGLLHLYPSQNKSLFKRIIDSGGIVASSFPLAMEPLPGNFPARNRIVTGLSRGCIVVQAAQKSGALISAHYAMEQGREVFAVPGAIDDKLSAGCNQIIQEGAKLIMSSADIFSEFGDRIVLREKAVLEQQVLFATSTSNPSILFEDKKLRASGGKKLNQKNKIDEKYSKLQQKIITACKQPASIEDIVSATQLSFEQVQSELFTFQLDGILSQDFMGMWMQE